MTLAILTEFVVSPDTTTMRPLRTKTLAVTCPIGRGIGAACVQVLVAGS